MVLSLDVMFWILRIIAALTDTMAIDFMIKPIDMNMEIIMIFVAFVSFVLIAKRKFLGAIIYMIGYFGYFGIALVTNLRKMTTTGGSVNDYGTVMFSLVGVALPIFTFLDLLLDKNRQLHPTDKKTDWFYKDEKYDMKKDERADKNNYRTL